MVRNLTWILALLLTCSVSAQTVITHYYHVDKISYKQKFGSDSLQKVKASENAMTHFHFNGYTGIAPTDTVVKRNSIHYYYSFTNQFKKIVLEEKRPKKSTSYPTKNFLLAVERIDKRIKDLENNGFPFARILIEEQTEELNTLNLTYRIDSGDYFIIDKVHIKSTDDFHEKTVLNTIGIKPGDPYNEEKIRTIEDILKNTNLYTQPRPAEILFKKGKAELYVYIQKKKSSNADGYIGFQQDRITERLVLNGFINLQLENTINRAEVMHLNWKNNPDQTQKLKANLEFPYLFGSPIGIGGNIDLQKQDTTFVRTDLILEIIYRNPRFRVSLFNQFENSTTITGIPQPGFRDYAKNTIGVNLTYKPFMPEQLRFYHPRLTASGGIFNYRADTLDDNKRKISNNKFLVKYEHEIDFLKFFHLNNSLQYQGLASSVGLSRNEFIYFGGLQSVRGFYELELAGKDIWILRNEVEFRPIEQLSLKALYDYARFDNETANYSHSFGFGFGLINNASQLEIIVANGVLNENPLLLSDTKVHIGFRSNF